MKKSNIKEIEIGFSCTQNFDSMSEISGGRHCEQCMKTVIDFTKYSDDQIIMYFEKSTIRTCGRFYKKQLVSIKNKQNVLPKSTSNTLRSLLFSFYLLLASCKTTKLDYQRCVPQKSNFVVIETLNKPNEKSLISGIIKDCHNEPLLFAPYSIGSEIFESADIDGKFNIEIDSNQIVNTDGNKNQKGVVYNNISDSTNFTFSYPGFDTLKLKYADIKNKEIEINLAEDENIHNEICVIGYAVPIKETIKVPIHKRIWNNIRSIFR